MARASLPARRERASAGRAPALGLTRCPAALRLRSDGSVPRLRAGGVAAERGVCDVL